jgi:hypothetical protein
MSKRGRPAAGRNRAFDARIRARADSGFGSASLVSCAAPKRLGCTIRAPPPSQRAGSRPSRLPIAPKGAANIMDELPVLRAQTRALYRFLLERVSNFNEFKHLVALYPATLPSGGEPAFATQIRALLHKRISQWLGRHVEALTSDELLCWRAIVVDDFFGVPAWFPKASGIC